MTEKHSPPADLKERLQARRAPVYNSQLCPDGPPPDAICQEAADRIAALEALHGNEMNRSLALEAQLAEARKALDNSQSLLVMVHHIGTEINHKSIPSIDWENEDLSKLLAEQVTENRASLQPKAPS